MKNRADFFNKIVKYNVISNSQDVNQYILRFTDIHDSVKDSHFQQKTTFTYNIFKRLSEEDKHKYIMGDGLNTLKYNVIEVTKMNTNIIKYKVSI